MKKLISLLTLAACTLSSMHASDAQTMLSQGHLGTSSQLAAASTGRAASEGSSTASSNVGAYIFAGVVVAAVVIAAVLVSKSFRGGNHSHSH